jgi:hypothetical protein
MEDGPDVILDVVFEDGLLYLALANIGLRPALQVETRFNRKLLGLGGTKDVSELPLFRKVEFLGPGREIRTLLDSAPSFFAGRRVTTLVARIAFRDETGGRHEKTIKHDLAIYRELAYVQRR